MKLYHLFRLPALPQASTMWTALLSLIAFSELIEIFLHPLRIPSEAAVQMECVQLMLAGRIPYVDFFTESVPLSFYLAGAPALIAKLLKLHPIFIFNLVTLIVSWLSVLLVAQLSKTNRTKITKSLILIFALLPIIFRFQLGQAEYIFIVLFFPFLLARWFRWQGQTYGKLSSIFAGIAAGIAINLNPFFVLFPIFLELFWFLEKRTARCLFTQEIYAMLAVTAMYWLHLLLYPANIVHSFLHSVLSFILLQLSCQDSYLMYQGSSPDQRGSIYAFALITILGLALRRRCTLILPLILFDFVAFLLFTLRGRGASSDLVLLNAVSLMLLPIVSYSLGETFHLPRFAAANRLLLLFAILASGGFLVYQWLSVHFKQFSGLESLGYRGYQNRQDLAPLTDLIEQYSKPGDPVLILTNGARAAYPLLLQLRRIPSSYYLSGYPIFLMHLADDQRFPKVLWQEMDTVPNQLTMDLLARKPVLVIMETGLPWEFLEKTSFGKALKLHYKNVAGRNLRDLDSPSDLAQVIEYIGQRVDFGIYVKNDDNEKP